MSLEFTGIGLGVVLETEDGGVLIGQVPMTGTPADNLTLLDPLSQGSKAYSDNGIEYRKNLPGTGADKWVEVGNTGDISWREPALVKEDTVYVDLTAAETAMNLGTVDGVAVVEGSRILYTAITGEAKNVFIVTGTPGAGATLVEDDNAATLNDVIRIDDGTFAEQVFYYDGADWVAPNEAVLTELTNIRAYIGKPTAGPVLPDYSSDQVVADDDDQTTAIGKLDAVANVPTIAAGNTGGATVTVDSILVDTYLSATWLVYVQETATQDTNVFEVTALHNGNTGNDAAIIKHTEKRIRIGNVNGVDLDVVLTGTGAAQTMDLQVTANNDFDVRAMRYGYII